MYVNLCFYKAFNNIKSFNKNCFTLNDKIYSYLSVKLPTKLYNITFFSLFTKLIAEVNCFEKKKKSEEIIINCL